MVNNQRRFKRDEHNINERIRHPEVRITGEDVDSRVVPIREALEIARKMGLDLVEIAPTAKPPVCRVIDYQKFLYDLKRKKKENKQKQENLPMKELRFTPTTDTHDFDFKIRHATEWLKEGHRVRVTVIFRGRAMKFKDQGELILARAVTALEEFGKAESLPKMEGKIMHVIISKKK